MNTLEFKPDSEELKSFISSCELVDEVDFFREDEDYAEYTSIYKTKDGKFFSAVYFQDWSGKHRLLEYLDGNSRVVGLTEVNPVQVTITRWDKVD